MIGGALLAGIFAAPAMVKAQVIDSVMASVDGYPITSHDIQAYSAANGITLPPPGDPKEQAVTHSVLKGLIEQKMLDRESDKYLDKVQDGQIDAQIQQIEQKNNITDQQFRDQLAANGLKYSEFRQHIRQQLAQMTMLQDEVRSKMVVSDAEVEAYYKAHPQEFQVTKERLALAQILIAVPPNAKPEQIAAAKAKAEEVRKKAVKGDDFAQLAAQYSDDDSKTKGGELGYFAPGEVLPQIEAAVENLKPGQISEVVRSDSGFHILKVEAHDYPGLAPLNDQTKAFIRDKLATEASKAHFQTWVENDLVKQHHIETFN